MKRQKGYYWIKKSNIDDWEPAYYWGNKLWSPTLSDTIINEKKITEIDERKIRKIT